jgi:hypothetical protein
MLTAPHFPNAFVGLLPAFADPIDQSDQVEPETMADLLAPFVVKIDRVDKLAVWANAYALLRLLFDALTPCPLPCCRSIAATSRKYRALRCRPLSMDLVLRHAEPQH